MPLRIPVTYRRVGQGAWEEGRVLNISESGVLFGPTTLDPGAEVEVIFSTPVPVGTMGPGAWSVWVKSCALLTPARQVPASGSAGSCWRS